MKYRPPADIVAKNTKLGLVCLGGLGVFGVGRMWVEDSEYKSRKEYSTAPEQEVHEEDMLAINRIRAGRKWTEYLNEQDAMRKAQLEEQIRSDH